MSQVSISCSHCFDTNTLFASLCCILGDILVEEKEVHKSKITTRYRSKNWIIPTHMCAYQSPSPSLPPSPFPSYQLACTAAANFPALRCKQPWSPAWRHDSGGWRHWRRGRSSCPPAPLCSAAGTRVWPQASPTAPAPPLFSWPAASSAQLPLDATGRRGGDHCNWLCGIIDAYICWGKSGRKHIKTFKPWKIPNSSTPQILPVAESIKIHYTSLILQPLVIIN